MYLKVSQFYLIRPVILYLPLYDDTKIMLYFVLLQQVYIRVSMPYSFEVLFHQAALDTT